MSTVKSILVTGCNRGLGRGIVELLSQQSQPLIIYAASRSGQDIGLLSTSTAQIKPVKLDISSSESIDAFFQAIQDIDVVINNAGVQSMGRKQTNEVYTNVLDVNFRGSLQMCQAAIPKLRKGGRIVNVSSAGCKLHNYSQPIQERWKRAFSDMTLQEVEDLVKEYETAFQTTSDNTDWPIEMPYCVSKTATNAITAILARQHPDLFINCCCPGFVKSDMGRLTGKEPIKTPLQGAAIPVRLALGDIGQNSGFYWENDSNGSLDNGHVSSW